MKKLSINPTGLLLILALGFASCKHSSVNSELALLDGGNLTFFDVTEQTFFKVDKETDSVVNGVFANDDKFYYCVDKNGELFLKYVDLNNDALQPVMVADWGVKTEACVTETYGTFSPLSYFPNKNVLTVYYDFTWDYYGFENMRLYDINSGKVKDYDWENDDSLWDDSMYEDEEWDFLSEDEQFYYSNNDDLICLSDQLDVKQYASDPDYAIDLYYYLHSVSPKGDMALFCAPIEAGDFEHGPYCVASLDGKFQMVFPETDFCQNEAAWLSDGSLVYQSADENTCCIKIMYPDHHIEILSYAYEFVKKQ